jgi:CheY-like chemotaxis protein
MSADTRGLILHVDDHRAVRDGLALLLRTDDYAVHSAAGTRQALELINTGLNPDVLIVDFHLEEQMNGAQLAEQICGILHYAPPIIVLSGYGADPPRTTDAPVWMTRKPLDPLRLLAALPGLIHLSRAARRKDTFSGLLA